MSRALLKTQRSKILPLGTMSMWTGGLPALTLAAGQTVGSATVTCSAAIPTAAGQWPTSGTATVPLATAANGMVSFSYTGVSGSSFTGCTWAPGAPASGTALASGGSVYLSPWPDGLGSPVPAGLPPIYASIQRWEVQTPYLPTTLVDIATGPIPSSPNGVYFQFGGEEWPQDNWEAEVDTVPTTLTTYGKLFVQALPCHWNRWTRAVVGEPASWPSLGGSAGTLSSGPTALSILGVRVATLFQQMYERFAAANGPANPSGATSLTYHLVGGSLGAGSVQLAAQFYDLSYAHKVTLNAPGAGISTVRQFSGQSADAPNYSGQVESVATQANLGDEPNAFMNGFGTAMRRLWGYWFSGANALPNLTAAAATPGTVGGSTISLSAAPAAAWPQGSSSNGVTFYPGMAINVPLTSGQTIVATYGMWSGTTLEQVEWNAQRNADGSWTYIATDGSTVASGTAISASATLTPAVLTAGYDQWSSYLPSQLDGPQAKSASILTATPRFRVISGTGDQSGLPQNWDRVFGPGGSHALDTSKYIRAQVIGAAHNVAATTYGQQIKIADGLDFPVPLQYAFTGGSGSVAAPALPGAWSTLPETGSPPGNKWVNEGTLLVAYVWSSSAIGSGVPAGWTNVSEGSSDGGTPTYKGVPIHGGTDGLLYCFYRVTTGNEQPSDWTFTPPASGNILYGIVECGIGLDSPALDQSVVANSGSTSVATLQAAAPAALAQAHEECIGALMIYTGAGAQATGLTATGGTNILASSSLANIGSLWIVDRATQSTTPSSITLSWTNGGFAGTSTNYFRGSVTR